MAFREYTFDDIERALKSQNKEYDVKSIEKAFLFGQKAHEGQFRKSGGLRRYRPERRPSILPPGRIHSEGRPMALCHFLL